MRKYKKTSKLVNNTGYTPGYSTENNPINYIPSEDITMRNTPYPVYGQPLDQNGMAMGNPTYMEPGYDYNYGDEASYVAEVPAYKDGGKKQAWISEKIGMLMGEGRPQKQAIAIAYSMWNQKHEDGGYQIPEYQNAGTVNFGQKPNGFSFYNRPPDFGTTVGYDPKIDPSKYGFGTDSQLSENALTAGEDWKKNNPLPQGMFASNLSDDATNTTTTTADPAKTGANGIHQFYNPYGDIGMGDALYFGGQEFAKGNNWKGAAGVGLGLLKGTKDFLAGMGNQKRQDTIMKSYNENQRKNMTGENGAVGMKMGGYYQDGGNKDKSNYEKEINAEMDKNYPEDAQTWYDQNPPGFNLPLDQEPAKEETAQKEVWQVWEEKTGKSWKEAKRLGYTDGTEKDNLKLLSELNDPRFKKENLRSKPLTGTPAKATPRKAEKKGPPTKTAKDFTYQDFQNAMKGKPKYSGKQANIGVPDEGTMISRGGERLANPLQTFGHYAKYGEAPAEGFSKNSKNAYDQVLGVANPMYWANALGNSADYAGEGEYKKAAIEALDAAPVLGKLKYVRYLPLPGKVPGLAQSTSKGLQVVNKEGSAVGPARKAAPLRNYFTPELAAAAQNAQLGQGAVRIGQGAKRIGQGAPQTGQLSFGFGDGGFFQEGGMQSPMEEQQEGAMSNPQEEQGEIPQQGGGDQMQEITQQVAQMLQQGADPQQVLEQLVQAGIPQEQAQQIIQMVMEQMQGGQQEATPQLKCGGKMYQEGGEAMDEQVEGEDEGAEGETPSMEQIEGQVEQALKQGADPQEILQQLVQMGMPEEQAIQMIQELLKEIQGGETEQEAPEQGQPMMKNGGEYLSALKGRTIKNYTYNKNTGNYDVEFE